MESVPFSGEPENRPMHEVMAQFDAPASSALTRQRFGGRPTRPGLIADLDQGHYFLRDDSAQ